MSEERPTANLPVNYRAQMANEAAEISKRIAAPSGDRIRSSSNRALITPDGMEGEELEVVVVDFISVNLFYEGAYDRDNPQAPACFALGDQPAILVPSANSPATQSDSCAMCPNNQFGSLGKGKACKNTRLLAVMPLSQDGEVPPIWLLSIPPTSLKTFDAYVQSLANRLKTTPVAVLTRITLDQSVTYFAPRFTTVRPLTDEELGVFFPQREAARQRLLVEPDVTQYAPPPAPAPMRGAPKVVRGRK